MAFILACFSVSFRGNHIRLYQIEAVLARCTIILDRRANGTTLDFDTTGRVRKSDLIMYDCQSFAGNPDGRRLQP